MMALVKAGGGNDYIEVGVTVNSESMCVVKCSIAVHVVVLF